MIAVDDTRRSSHRQRWVLQGLAWLRVIIREMLWVLTSQLRPRMHLLLLVTFLLIPSLAMLRSVLFVPFEWFLQGVSGFPVTLSLFILLSIGGRLIGRGLYLADKEIMKSSFIASLPVYTSVRMAAIAVCLLVGAFSIVGGYGLFYLIDGTNIDGLSIELGAGIITLVSIVFLSSSVVFLPAIYCSIVFPVVLVLCAIASVALNIFIICLFSMVMSFLCIALSYVKDGPQLSKINLAYSLRESYSSKLKCTHFPEWSIKLLLISDINKNTLISDFPVYVFALSFALILLVDDPWKALSVCVAAATSVAVFHGLRFRELSRFERRHPFLGSLPRERLSSVLGVLLWGSAKELLMFAPLCVVAAWVSGVSVISLAACVMAFALKLIVSYSLSRIFDRNYIFWLCMVLGAIIGVEAVILF